MAKRKPKFPDGLVDLPLPSGGLDEAAALEYQPPNTSADMQNVRGTHPISGKNALCQRSGIQPYCPVALSGDHHVQEIHHVIVERAQAVEETLGKTYVPLTTSFIILGPDGTPEVYQPSTSGMTPGPGTIDDSGNTIVLQSLPGQSVVRTQRFDNKPRGTAINFQRQRPFGFGNIPQGDDDFDPQDDQFAVQHKDDELPGGLDDGGQGQAGELAPILGGGFGVPGGVGGQGGGVEGDPKKKKKKPNKKKNDNKKKRDEKRNKPHKSKNQKHNDDDDDDDSRSYDDEQADEDIDDLSSPTGGYPGGQTTAWRLQEANFPAQTSSGLSRSTVGQNNGKGVSSLTVAGVVYNSATDAIAVLVAFKLLGGATSVSLGWGAHTVSTHYLDSYGTIGSDYVLLALFRMDAATITDNATNDVVVTFGTTVTSAVVLVEKATSTNGVGLGGWAEEDSGGFFHSGSASINLTTTSIDRASLIIAAVATNGPEGDTDGTWGGGFTGSQIDGTTGGTATDNMKLSSGYRESLSANTVYTPSKTGITARNRGIVALQYVEGVAVADVYTTLAVALRGGIAYSLVAINSATYLWRQHAESGELLDGTSPWLNSSSGSNKTLTWVDRSHDFNVLMAIGEAKIAQVSQNASGIQIRIITRSTGAVVATTVVDASASLACHDLTADGDDNFYVVWGSASATQPNRLTKYNSAGVLQWTATGSTRIFGASYDRVHGKLYATGTAIGGGSNDLSEINVDTGAETTGTTVTGAPFTSIVFDGRSAAILGKANTVAKVGIT